MANSKWDPHLTEKTRVLLHVAPLIQLKRSGAFRDEPLRHYDGLALALKLFDVVAENMGLPRAIDRAFLLEETRPLLEAMDAAAGIAPDAQRHRGILDRVLADLRNDDDGRLPFQEAYQDFDDSGAAIRRALEFRLVSDEHHAAGGTTLRLSNEAINLYLRALDLDIEDAQTAAEAVVQSQLARGKFDEAVHSAEVANLQSVRYKGKIERVLRDTQRDVRRVDWREEIPRLLNEAKEHIDTRMKAEQAIIGTANERLDLVPETMRRRVADVLRLTQECFKRHVHLHQRLMQAAPVFLDAHARQAFLQDSAVKAPDLFSQILTPLMQAHRNDASRILEATIPALCGAHPRPAGSVKALVLWALRPKRTSSSEDILVEDQELCEGSLEQRRYPPELIVEIRRALQSLGGRVKLSSLLDQMRERGDSIESRELTAMLVLEQFAPDNTADRMLKVSKTAARFDSQEFAGDELELEAAAAEES